MTEQQKLKLSAIDLLKESVPQHAERLMEIDARLLTYYNDLCEHSGIEPDDPNDWHNLLELCAALKMLRFIDSYVVDVDKVRQVLRLREGYWHQDERGIWQYDRGGLLLPGVRGATHYRWMPFQVFIMTAMYGFRVWIDTEVPNGSRELLPTEREGDGGTIEDLRRLCTDFTFYAPRKTDKTGLSAYNNFLYFMLEDADAEIYCCANSQTQSKLLYDRTQMLIRQMDTQSRRIRFTASTTNWKPGQIRSAQLWALSAGGKTKDGLFAQLCCADEFGSAGYVNDKSDMGALVNVVLSSMGPRREPMMFTSTTAGTIQQGPFIDKLDGMKRELLRELEETTTDLTDGRLRSPQDRWMILPLCPDEWQMDEEYLLTSKTVRRKVNPALGIIVQNSFYEQSVAESRLDPLKKVETLTKLFNVYQLDRMQEWITPDQVRAMQIERRIDDCTYDEGWSVYAAFDFSHGDDFDAVSFLATRWNDVLGCLEYFADCDAWVNRKAFLSSPYRPLYERWEHNGWLHVSGDTVVSPSAPVERIMALDKAGVNFMAFGYDAYQSREPILLLKEWLANEIGHTKPDTMVVPVSQTFAAYNASVQKIEYAVGGEVYMRFSGSPLWPWEFGNCVLAVDSRMENKKPLKRSANCKVDNVQCLASCFTLEETFQQKI